MKKYYGSLFKNSDNSGKPIGTVDVIEWCLDPNSKKAIMKLRRIEDPELQKSHKNTLPAITVSGTFSCRNRKGLIEHNSLIALDVDGKDNLHLSVEEIKQQIFENQNVILVMESCRGGGAFALVEISDPDNHYKHFKALCEDFADMGLAVDSRTSDVTRLRIQSYDLNPFYRTDAIPYTRQSDGATKRHKAAERKSKQVISCRPNVKWTPKINEAKTIEELAAQLLNRAPLEKWSTGSIPTDFNGTQVALYLILSKVANSGFDITCYAPDWITIAGAMTTHFGEWGRELFHDLCCNYKKYTRQECDDKYDEFIHSESYPYAVSTIREIAEHYGF